jgi:multidrug efflux pump subunit AcrA (membrane-fusion protein)
MKRKQIIIGVIVTLCAGLGIYALVKSHGGVTSSDEDEATPSVVTVQVGSLKRMTLHNYVSGYGTIESEPATADEPAASAQLAAPVAGVVAKINAIAGQRVKKDDVLVELNSGTTMFDYAEAEVERQKKLFAQQNTSLRNLQDAEAQLASLEIVAPLSGTVTLVNVKLGQAVDATTIVAEVMDLNRLAVSAQIPAADAGELKTGEEVQLPGSTPVTTSLSFVSPAVNANDGTISIWASLPPDGGFRPGQFVQLKIVTAVHTNCLVAPSESVVTDENGKSVIALVKGDEATQLPVKIGLSENGWVEIKGANLKEGDSVVTTGAYGLPDKTKIQIVNSADEAATNSSSVQ